MASDLKLNLGSGPNVIEGWVNIDRSPGMVLDRLPGAKQVLHRLGAFPDAHMVRWPKGILRSNIVNGLPFPRHSVSAVYSAHALEHLYLDDVRKVLAECKRVMLPGTRIRVALPDGERWARELVAGDADGVDGPGLTYNQRLGAHDFARPRGLRRITALAGATSHRWQPTRDLVRSLFAEAGFTDFEERNFLEGDLPHLQQVEQRSDSMFFEAIA